MTAFPTFTLDGYRALLITLRDLLGYALHPTTDITRVTGRAVFLRHDVDLHLAGALDMTAVEESLGVRSTWYVGTRLAYNPAYGPNAAVIRELVEHGHTVGLHYVAGQTWLEGDLDTLGRIAECGIDTWVMHEPSAGGVDNHLEGFYGRGNPSSTLPRLHYVSDSRMMWTQPYIGALLDGTPERAMLNTHHEHWIGGGTRRARALGIRAQAWSDQLAYMDHLLTGYADGEIH